MIHSLGWPPACRLHFDDRTGRPTVHNGIEREQPSKARVVQVDSHAAPQFLESLEAAPHRYLAVSLLVLCAFLGGCCDKTTKRVQPYWSRTTEDYLLQIERIDEGLQPVLITPGDSQRNSFEQPALAGRIDAEYDRFRLELTNKSSKPIRLLWPEARYVDEKGMNHELSRRRLTDLPSPSEMKVSQPVTVSESEMVHEVITPIYKSYPVVFRCKDLSSFREPLIPTKLDDKTEHQIKTYVEDLARREIPVKLFLPIEIEGKRHDYTFTFVLRDRWADLMDREKEKSQ